MINLCFFGSPPTVAERGRDPRPLAAQPKRIALLAYLAVSPHKRFVSREHLLDLLWPEDSPNHARSSLRTAIHSLRSILGEDAIVRQGNATIGAGPGIISDVADFRGKLEAGSFAEALALMKGEFLAGLHVDDAPGFQEWLHAERTEQKRIATGAALGLAKDEVARHNLPGAIFWLRRAETIGGKDEEVSQRLMVALTAGGNIPAAVHEYGDLRKWLEHHLDASPSEQTEAIIAQIRRGETPPLARYFAVTPTSGLRNKPETRSSRATDVSRGGVHPLHFRDLVELADDVIYRTDLFGCFTYTNPAGERLLGLPLSSIIGRAFVDFIREDFRSHTLDFYLRQLQEQVESTYFEFPVVVASGDTRWLGQRVQLVRNEGVVVGIQAIARDITVNRRARQFEATLTGKPL